jgi:hypothetical protein
VKQGVSPPSPGKLGRAPTSVSRTRRLHRSPAAILDTAAPALPPLSQVGARKRSFRSNKETQAGGVAYRSAPAYRHQPKTQKKRSIHLLHKPDIFTRSLHIRTVFAGNTSCPGRWHTSCPLDRNRVLSLAQLDTRGEVVHRLDYAAPARATLASPTTPRRPQPTRASTWPPLPRSSRR